MYNICLLAAELTKYSGEIGKGIGETLYMVLVSTIISYVIGLPTSSEKRFYGEDRKLYSVSMASMDTMGMSMFSP